MPNQDPQQHKLTREEQEKGGQHSHQGSENQGDRTNQGNRTPPSKEDAAKGGQRSHSSGNR